MVSERKKGNSMEDYSQYKRNDLMKEAKRRGIVVSSLTKEQIIKQLKSNDRLTAYLGALSKDKIKV